MTQVTTSLIAHIEADNAERQAEMDATPGLTCFMSPTSLEYLESNKLHTVYDWELYHALNFYCEVHKDLYGYNADPRQYGDTTWDQTLIQVNMLIDALPRYTHPKTGKVMIGFEWEDLDQDEVELMYIQEWKETPQPINNPFQQLLDVA